MDRGFDLRIRVRRFWGVFGVTSFFWGPVKGRCMLPLTGLSYLDEAPGRISLF